MDFEAFDVFNTDCDFCDERLIYALGQLLDDCQLFVRLHLKSQSQIVIDILNEEITELSFNLRFLYFVLHMSTTQEESDLMVKVQYFECIQPKLTVLINKLELFLMTTATIKVSA